MPKCIKEGDAAFRKPVQMPVWGNTLGKNRGCLAVTIHPLLGEIGDKSSYDRE